jgi:hypothetical protein
MTYHSEAHLCILEEGSNPLPRCETCGMHVPYTALNEPHPNSKQCKRGTELRARRQRQEEHERAQGLQIQLNDVALPTVTTFCYLGRVLAANNSN